MKILPFDAIPKSLIANDGFHTLCPDIIIEPDTSPTPAIVYMDKRYVVVHVQSLTYCLEFPKALFASYPIVSTSHTARIWDIP